MSKHDEERTIIEFSTGLTIKAAGDWELDVLGVPFGGPKDGKDADGQFFSQKTNLYLDNFTAPLIVYYHGYSPEGQPMGEPEIIGKTERHWNDEQGHWWRVVLDKANEFARRVWEAAKDGAARASSGSVAHLVRWAQDGEITHWPVAEISLFDALGGRQPANAYAVALPVAKATYLKAGTQLPDIDNEPQPEATGTGDERPGAAEKSTQKTNEDVDMDENQVSEIVAKALKADREAREAEAKAQADEQAKVDAAVKAEREKWEAEAAKSRRLPGGMPHVSEYADTGKYDHMSAADLGLMIDVQQELHAKNPTKSQPVNPAAIKALMLRVARIEQDKVSDETAAYAKSALKSVIGSQLTDEAIKAATDPAYSTGSNIGADWVGTAYSNQLWESIRADARIVAKIPAIVIPDGYSSEYYPLESTDPTWYKVAEATASDATLKVPAATVTASQMGTLNKQITVGKMGARAIYTGELTEDSLINYAPQLRLQLQKSGQEMMEHLVIDGDSATEAVTNINDIGNAEVQSAANLHLLVNGFRKLALVTNSANSRAGGALDEDDYLETMWLMGTAGLAGADVSKCSFIVDPNVYKASLKLATVKTKDVWTNATVEKGVLSGLWGYEILPSWFMHYKSAVRKSDSAGKVNQTDATANKFGSILGVRWDQWKLAYKRRMTMETTRIANADAWEIVALARWGLGCRDNEAVAISYGISV
jgi:hypothetical protein